VTSLDPLGNPEDSGQNTLADTKAGPVAADARDPQFASLGSFGVIDGAQSGALGLRPWFPR
jgi:hypothetical protein